MKLLDYSLCTFAMLIPFSHASAQKDTRPNIVFILSDDHSSQAWGVYGGILAPYVKNENIKRLAKEGCVLDNAFCTNAVCTPSRASIYTGRYSHKDQVYTLADSLSGAMPNIAKTLQSSGYHTAVFGKWHLKARPEGFDYFSVFHDQGEYVDPTFKNSNETWRYDNFGERVHGFSTDIVADKVIKWMGDQAKDHPFMVFCNFKATHEPFDFPQRNKHLYDGVVFPEPANLMEFSPEQSGRTFTGQQLEELARRWMTASQDPDKWWCRYPELPFTNFGLDSIEARKATYQKLIRDFLRCGATIDDNIGRILNKLDSMGIADNTVVIYTADQGYFLGEHGFFDKRLFYEESLHMPFVIRYPKEIKGGTRNKDFVLNVDFASLMADYAQVRPPEGAQGVSFRKNLEGNTPPDWRKTMYYRYWTQSQKRPAHIGVRTTRYKLMFLYGDKLNTNGSSDYVSKPSWEFYDLKEDPHENHNAYRDAKYAKTIKKMKQLILDSRKQLGDTDQNSQRMQAIMKENF